MSDNQTLYAAFTGHLAAALDALEAAGTLPGGLKRGAITVEPPRDPSHGDLSTNAAMVLAKPAGMKPRDVAEAAIGGMLSGRRTVVPGVVPKVVSTGGRFAPRSLLLPGIRIGNRFRGGPKS